MSDLTSFQQKSVKSHAVKNLLKVKVLSFFFFKNENFSVLLKFFYFALKNDNWSKSIFHSIVLMWIGDKMYLFPFISHDLSSRQKRLVILLVNVFFIYQDRQAHYSKSQIFVQKFNIDKTPTFSRVFHPIFLTIFLVKSKLSTAKKSKTTTFSRVFHPPKIDNFYGKSKLNFWTKNEDFEQCVILK